MIKIDNLIKKYQDKIILDNISYEFKRGSIYFIKGENGSGKSTLIKILTKIIYKTSGNVDNKINISYLPDKYVLPKLINSYNYLANFGADKSKINEYINKYELPNKLIMNLSKGNLQKVGIIEVLLNDYEAYIFDEPLDGLDKNIKEIFLDDLKKLVNKNKLVILISHSDISFKDINYKKLIIEEGKLHEA